MKKKICVITAARSEYGLLRWLMTKIKDNKYFNLQVVVTGSHLSADFGFTYKDIENDGFVINKKIDMKVRAGSQRDITRSMGNCILGLTDTLLELDPDLIIVLGDRYELLPICSTSLLLNIPIAHISGGDITEGAIDDVIRNAITKMASLHFPSSKASAQRISKMAENVDRIFPVGALNIDAVNNLDFLSRTQLAKMYQLDSNQNWILMTFHPETMVPLKENISRLNSLLTVLAEMPDTQTLITYPNADYGSDEIIRIIKNVQLSQPDKFIFVDNMGQLKYLSFMRVSVCMVGNSSSAVFESPVMQVPAINIGNRQKGRFLAKNVVSVTGSEKSLRQAFQIINKTSFKRRLKSIKHIYGDGWAAEKVLNVLHKIFTNNSKERILNKNYLLKV